MANARAKAAPLWANTTLGLTTLKQCLSLAWSVEIKL